MCEIIERNRAEARAMGHAEGRAMGHAEGRLSILTKLVKLNKLSIKEAADEADMTEAAFKKLALQ
ncbi:MAG: hypothetical protein MSS66_01505 [Selenomonadaceae bacterium]|nr:hypothetical protein [Selenomonadaceae bacterium]